jgi:DNA modification methylase
MLIWAKSNFVLGRSDYNYQHEPLIYGWVEGAGHQFFGESNESSVWEIPKPSASRLHPTMKPIELVARSIRNSCPARGTVLDPFGGSGSTLIAAQTEGRTACLMELDPRYVDVICRRYQEHTGDIPVLESTGEPHDFTRPEDSVSKG